ncbi:M6 family metalloprotease domain-containing protein [Bacillus salipaludis]|uniref:M6 family metalloprotease domain-containing protein n=1 Tax=Bacillus salipaludis TaxID=2547811 RepID=A0A4R5VUX7_9BACI|nr:M6 family metalloprotease domain-containing protein [Bacillus salipaludis]MDQ6597610.1 M6 family metalloprotease domain-containing protein [Bacillus salipaludis]TDK62978.1 M6 family metalloprotease domain-containing protein [Bacillus salipaludis]
MWKVLSTTALSLALLGGAASGISANQLSKPSKYQLSTPEMVSPSPEYEAYAKAKGLDLTKQAKKLKNLPNGKKFNAPGNNHVTYSPTKSNIPMLVLLVKFKDEQPLGAPAEQVPAKYFNDLIFGDRYNPYELPEFKQYDGPNVPKDKTMQNAYKESSYGKVTLTTDDAPTEWITLPHNADFYLSQKLGDLDNTNGYAHVGQLVADTLEAADAQVDFSKYAVDGVVPNVFIVHAGTGAEWSGDPQQIWSHKWDIQSALYYGKYYQDGTLLDVDEFMNDNAGKWTKDGVEIGTYTIEPEIGGNVAGYDDTNGKYSDALKSGPYPTQAGVFSHEFGHALGLPDLYDVDYSSEGAGNYTIMAGGSWMSYPNGNAYMGNSPTSFDPFSKIFLGWAEPINVKPADGAKTITLKPVNQSNSNNAFVKMEVPGSNGTEYYLFENIQQVGFNQGLGREGANAHGLVAWHVDENTLSHYQQGYNDVNSVESFGKKLYNVSTPVNGVSHYGLSVVQKDGNFDLEKGVNRGDEKDFFQTGDVLKSNGANVYSGSFYFYKGYSATGLSGINVKDIKENPDGSITATFFYQNDK